MSSAAALRVVRRNDPAAVRRILSSLPEWFGIPDANDHYVGAAGDLPSYLAVVDDDVVGVLLISRHFDSAAEVFLIAVAAAQRNKGVGSVLLEAAQDSLRAEGVHFLQVKTLGPSRAVGRQPMRDHDQNTVTGMPDPPANALVGICLAG